MRYIYNGNLYATNALLDEPHSVEKLGEVVTLHHHLFCLLCSPGSHKMKAPRLRVYPVPLTAREDTHTLWGIFIFPRKRIVANEARRHNSLRWHCQCINNAQAIRNLCKLCKLSPSIVAQQSDLDSQQLFASH